MTRILVVDDESNIRMMLKIALGHAGYAVETAADATEGLERFGPTGARWDLVLLDLRLPDVTGLEVLKEMRARRPETRVILITAFGTFDLVDEAARAGAYHFLRKPFTIEVLRGAVHAALQEGCGTSGASPQASPPQGYDRFGINGYRIASEPDGVQRTGRDVEVRFTVVAPGGAGRTVGVYLPLHVVETVEAYVWRGGTPGEDALYRDICGGALANHLWQHSELPSGDVLRVEGITSGFRQLLIAVPNGVRPGTVASDRALRVG